MYEAAEKVCQTGKRNGLFRLLRRRRRVADFDNSREPDEGA